MQSILDAINEWIKEILIGAINGNLSTMFGDVNEKVGTIAAEVGQTPQGWNASIFSMIQTLSENVIIPLAGLVITYVLCVELISMVTEKNNMHDVDTFMFFKWFFKAWVAVYLVTHTFDITMAIFDVAQRVVSGAAGVIGGDTNIDVTAALSSMQDGLNDMEIPELLLLVMETSLVSLCMKIMSVLITVILYGRMIEIYLYCSVSPIPFATMTNREWGQIGSNYLKSLFALGFQGFLIMICVGIYAVLVNTLTVADNLHSAIFSIAAYTVMKMLLGLTKPTSGEVKIWGKSLQGNEKKLLPRIGSLIESPGFYPNLTATENLRIFAALRGVPNSHAIKDALDLVGLPYKDKKLFSQYSLGMKQRLAIALAVMHDPELLILDEPINGLDPIGIAEVRSFIRELCDARGKTILISSHILSEISLLADDIGIIDHGALLEEESLAELEAKSSKHIRFTVSDTAQAARLLERTFHENNFSIQDDHNLRLHNLDLPVGKIVTAFVENGLEVSEAHTCEESLEDYFKRVTGGEGIA